MSSLDQNLGFPLSEEAFQSWHIYEIGKNHQRHQISFKRKSWHYYFYLSASLFDISAVWLSPYLKLLCSIHYLWLKYWLWISTPRPTSFRPQRLKHLWKSSIGESNLQMHASWRPKLRSDEVGDSINLTGVLKALFSELQTKDEKTSGFRLFSMFCLTAPGCFLESSCFTISSWHIFPQQSRIGVKNRVAKHSSLPPRIINEASFLSFHIF